MNKISRFETLTNRKILIEERAERFISDLQRIVRLLEADIEIEKERAGVSDPKNPNYSTLARAIGARRDNLIATIERLKSSTAPA